MGMEWHDALAGDMHDQAQPMHQTHASCLVLCTHVSVRAHPLFIVERANCSLVGLSKGFTSLQSTRSLSLAPRVMLLILPSSMATSECSSLGYSKWDRTMILYYQNIMRFKPLQKGAFWSGVRALENAYCKALAIGQPAHQTFHIMRTVYMEVWCTLSLPLRKYGCQSKLIPFACLPIQKLWSYIIIIIII